MKKLVLLVIAIVTCTTVSAQKFEWGVKAGVNLSGITGVSVRSDMRLGYTAGLFGQVNTCVDGLGVAAELLVSSNGAVGGGEKAVWEETYINLPIMATYRVWNNLSVKAGVQPAILLGASVGGISTTAAGANNLQNSFDLSIPVGVSYAFDLGLIVDLRYNFGVTNIIKAESQPLFGKLYNSALTLSVGWRF